MPEPLTRLLAAVLIALAVLKLCAVLLAPQGWLHAMRRLYARPALLAALAYVLAALVLYALLASGLSIVQILAVCLFMALLTMAGMVPLAPRLLEAMAEPGALRRMMRAQWLYVLVWLALLAWGLAAMLA
ncbi:hypothetical protein BKK79_03170 [Cupriavidus sp. USMAA2-4]|uniref:hypothetical protein n=1 Tax=Cupriavidus sp. USMAA2-4 TaxID=876364 RepID=UPI0008A67C9D|nr:hypothetical protein [Cupriavidus sp. USMAA2-4]AOY90924.1 hypothetical protein BKK79_03170 [Cupriavidus sp. USMAA2-4]